MRLWQVEKQFGLHSWYFSQAGQDRYLNERVFRNKRDGTFVEIGGYDGWTGSNCVFFEKVLGWTGLVVEASPQLVRRIGETRSARVVHTAIADRDGAAEFLDVTSGLTQMGGLLDHYHAEKLQRIRRDERHSEIAVTVPSTRLDTHCSAPTGSRRSITARSTWKGPSEPPWVPWTSMNSMSLRSRSRTTVPAGTRIRTSWNRPATSRSPCSAWTKSGSNGRCSRARQESEDSPYGGIERALVGRFLGWEDSDRARGAVD